MLKNHPPSPTGEAITELMVRGKDMLAQCPFYF
jgi:hypothetical protein